MRTYIVPLIIKKHPVGHEYRTADVEPGVSWVGQPIGGDRYLIRTPHEMDDLPPGRERGERNRLNAQQMRNTARENGMNPDAIERNWFVGGS